MSATRTRGAADTDSAGTRAGGRTGTATAGSSRATDPYPTNTGRTRRAGTARPRGSADSDPTGRSARACRATAAVPAASAAAPTTVAAATASRSASAAGAPAAPSAAALRERDADIRDALHRGDERNGKQDEGECHDTGS